MSEVKPFKDSCELQDEARADFETQIIRQARLSTAREILGEIRAKYYAEMPYEDGTIGLVHIPKADFEQMESRFEEEK